MPSRAQENRYGNAREPLSEQRRPVPSSLAQPRCSQSHDLDASGGFLWRGDPSSPTTFSPCGLSHPSPDALCVLRRELEGPEEATPSLRRRAMQARYINGPPPPAPRPRHDTASAKHLDFFEDRTRGYHPGLEETPERHESLARHGDHPHPSHALAPIAEALAKPHTQGAIWLQAQPTPRQLCGHPAHRSEERRVG